MEQETLSQQLAGAFDEFKKASPRRRKELLPNMEFFATELGLKQIFHMFQINVENCY
jgi:hypothetical protein